MPGASTMRPLHYVPIPPRDSVTPSKRDSVTGIADPSLQTADRKPHGAPRKDGTPRRDEMPGYGEPPPNMGRPRVYSTEARKAWQTLLLEWLQDGRSLRSFCAAYPQGPGSVQFLQWRSESDDFAHNYSRARQDGADAMADDVTDIADSVKDAGRDDSARVNAARLRCDARKWAASKLKPQSYADRLETNVTGSVSHTVTLDDDARARALAAFVAMRAMAQAGSMPEAQRLLSSADIADVSRMIDVTPADRDAVTGAVTDDNVTE